VVCQYQTNLGVVVLPVVSHFSLIGWKEGQMGDHFMRLANPKKRRMYHSRSTRSLYLVSNLYYYPFLLRYQYTLMLPNDCLYYDLHHILNKSDIMQSGLLRI
jgi:hypothetical protein